MTTLDDKLAEQGRIKAELKRMEDDDSVSEEENGDLRDTLIARWRKLDDECKPIVARMKEIQQITRAADDEANLERPDPGGGGDGNVSRGRYGSDTPELVTRNNPGPYEGLEAVRYHQPGSYVDRLLMQRPEVRERALDAIELEAKRGNLAHDHAEAVTRRATDSLGIQEHILLTGAPEYQDMFRAYINNPQGMASRAALSLTNANGGYLLPFVLDQVAVA